MNPTSISLRNSRTAWGAISIVLHWLFAGLLTAQCVLGWMAVSWKLSPTKISLFVWHKSLGLLLLALVALRLAWRASNPVPDFPRDTPMWQQHIARLSHGLLYVILFAMPITGWIVNSAANIPFRVFGWFPLPALTTPDKALAALMKTVHFGLFVALAVAVTLHVIAALHHHYGRHDQILRRMIAFRRSS